MDPELTRAGTGLPSRDFWSGRKVLVTGHTGFKGSWLTLWLSMLGARIQGLSLPGAGEREFHWGSLDVTLEDELRTDIVGTDWQVRVREFGPEVIIHLAAQSIVSTGYASPFETFSTNIMGTARVLDFLTESLGVSALLVATTDKVYDARQEPPHAENAFLGGSDPYSASKAGAELVIGAWPPRNAAVVAARAGNVIGGGDWSPDRLVPDLVRSWGAGHHVTLREPDGVRPWQHVLEPLAGYLIYLEAAFHSNTNLPRALNFGPADQQRVSVREVVTMASLAWADLMGLDDPPGYEQAPESARIGETAELRIDSRRAENVLGWRSRLHWQEAVHMTLEWYAGVARGHHPADLSRQQIQRYVGGEVA